MPCTISTSVCSAGLFSYTKTDYDSYRSEVIKMLEREIIVSYT